MLYLFKSIRILVCSLIPNIIPLVITAGIMGWVGRSPETKHRIDIQRRLGDSHRRYHPFFGQLQTRAPPERGRRNRDRKTNDTTYRHQYHLYLAGPHRRVYHILFQQLRRHPIARLAYLPDLAGGHGNQSCLVACFADHRINPRKKTCLVAQPSGKYYVSTIGKFSYICCLNRPGRNDLTGVRDRKPNATRIAHSLKHP